MALMGREMAWGLGGITWAADVAGVRTGKIEKTEASGVWGKK